MDIVRVPSAVHQQPQLAAGDIAFVDYRDRGGFYRTRVLFDCYAFSFVQNGQKQIYRATENTIVTPGYAMLISEGNSIIAEHSNTSALYHSFIVFFPGRLGREFMLSRPATPMVKSGVPYVCFKTNTYIQEYVRGVQALINSQQTISPEMAALKVTELLTAVFELEPDLLRRMFEGSPNVSLKALVERNLLNPLTLEELAFLANRSLSSFKRDFQQAYGVSPQKYIRDRRLEMARAELAAGKLASQLYLDYGYQHLANFNTAFKRKFGITPADCRQSA